ncbi:MAG TPA: hypothetical protein VIE64_02760 [Solirubrobacterales bacterium]|jgi:hypothetical protein
MVRQGDKLNRGADYCYPRRATLKALAVLSLTAIAILAAPLASAGAEAPRLTYAPGKIVPIPASIPHEEGDMVDRRIIPDLRWIASRFPIYVTDGYSGPLPAGKRAGCDRCHTRNSDHYNGLAVDIVPATGTSGRCEGQWNAITRLAHWAEPVQNHPIAPFRWVGYDGDAGHGCGHHLHLSWNHAPVAEHRLAAWVEVLSSGASGTMPKLPTPSAPASNRKPAPKAPGGPSGGISQFQSGGVSPRRD